jgi:cell division protein FtsW
MFSFRLCGDRVIWAIIFLLTLVSLVSVYSSTSTLALRYQSGDTEYYFFKHAILLGAGLVVTFLVHKFDYRLFARLSLLLLPLCIILLVITLLQGEENEINQASRWINIFGQSFQPSDLAKFTLVAYLAKDLAKMQDYIRDFYKAFLPTITWVLLICGLIAPSNLSTALLIFACCTLLMYIAGVNLTYLAGLGVAGVLGLIVLVQVADRAPTWKSRYRDFIDRIFNPHHTPSYQTVQANVAIASGGLLGRGAGKSVQRNYLPHPYSDFIYAIIVEEYGLLGGLFVLGLYLMLLIRTVAIVTISRTFGALLAIGLALMIVMQALINMGVTVGILPVTGLPLPLISLGGTSILLTGLSLGAILSVSKKAIETAREDLETFA